MCVTALPAWVSLGVGKEISGSLLLHFFTVLIFQLLLVFRFSCGRVLWLVQGPDSNCPNS